MKIVINRCYGGFGLSKKARDLLAERGFKHAQASQKDDPKGKYSYNYYVLDKTCQMDDIEFRTHPMVIAVVEELGREANAECASLKIINLNHTIEIEDHDGMETVNGQY